MRDTKNQKESEMSKETTRKGNYCYLEREVLTDKSVVYNVVLYEETTEDETTLIILMPASREEANTLYETIEKLA